MSEPTKAKVRVAYAAAYFLIFMGLAAFGFIYFLAGASSNPEEVGRIMGGIGGAVLVVGLISLFRASRLAKQLRQMNG